MQAARADAVARRAEDFLRDCARALLTRAGDPGSARLEAEVLLASILGCSRGSLLTLDTLEPESVAACQALVDRRVADGYPVAYLVGRREFCDLSLAVDERVLVPRPETETLVGAFDSLDDAGVVPPGPVIDWGTGSGALALMAARRRPVLAVDRSAPALQVAADNVARCTARAPAGSRAILLCRGDALSAVSGESVAAVLANPPYVEPGEWAELPDDVRHEPRAALIPEHGDVDELYAQLAREATRVLLPGGWLLTEIGWGQADRVASCCERAGLGDLRRLLDLAGVERVIAARRS
jgi:release factor glutamine methyltransferase